MKRIIEAGRTDPIVRKFACRNCRCVFEATRDDYDVEFDRNEYYFASSCPHCGHKTYSYEMNSSCTLVR